MPFDFPSFSVPPLDPTNSSTSNSRWPTPHHSRMNSLAESEATLTPSLENSFSPQINRPSNRLSPPSTTIRTPALSSERPVAKRRATASFGGSFGYVSSGDRGVGNGNGVTSGTGVRPVTRGQNRWLLVVIPSGDLSEGSVDENGVLVVLQPTLGSQIITIIQTFSLDSPHGLSLHLILPSDGPTTTAVTTFGPSPKITEEVWPLLFSNHIAQRSPDSFNGTLPIAAKLQLRVDSTRARWFPEWLKNVRAGRARNGSISIPARLASTPAGHREAIATTTAPVPVVKQVSTSGNHLTDIHPAAIIPRRGIITPTLIDIHPASTKPRMKVLQTPPSQLATTTNTPRSTPGPASTRLATILDSSPKTQGPDHSVAEKINSWRSIGTPFNPPMPLLPPTESEPVLPAPIVSPYVDNHSSGSKPTILSGTQSPLESPFSLSNFRWSISSYGPRTPPDSPTPSSFHHRLRQMSPDIGRRAEGSVAMSIATATSWGCPSPTVGWDVESNANRAESVDLGERAASPTDGLRTLAVVPVVRRGTTWGDEHNGVQPHSWPYYLVNTVDEVDVEEGAQMTRSRSKTESNVIAIPSPNPTEHSTPPSAFSYTSSITSPTSRPRSFSDLPPNPRRRSGPPTPIAIPPPKRTSGIQIMVPRDSLQGSQSLRGKSRQVTDNQTPSTTPKSSKSSASGVVQAISTDLPAVAKALPVNPAAPAIPRKSSARHTNTVSSAAVSKILEEQSRVIRSVSLNDKNPPESLERRKLAVAAAKEAKPLRVMVTESVYSNADTTSTYDRTTEGPSLRVAHDAPLVDQIPVVQQRPIKRIMQVAGNYLGDVEQESMPLNLPQPTRVDYPSALLQRTKTLPLFVYPNLVIYPQVSRISHGLAGVSSEGYPFDLASIYPKVRSSVASQVSVGGVTQLKHATTGYPSHLCNIYPILPPSSQGYPHNLNDIYPKLLPSATKGYPHNLNFIYPEASSADQAPTKVVVELKASPSRLQVSSGDPSRPSYPSNLKQIYPQYNSIKYPHNLYTIYPTHVVKVKKIKIPIPSGRGYIWVSESTYLEGCTFQGYPYNLYELYPMVQRATTGTSSSTMKVMEGYPWSLDNIYPEATATPSDGYPFNLLRLYPKLSESRSRSIPLVPRSTTSNSIITYPCHYYPASLSYIYPPVNKRSPSTIGYPHHLRVIYPLKQVTLGQRSFGRSHITGSIKVYYPHFDIYPKALTRSLAIPAARVVYPHFDLYPKVLQSKTKGTATTPPPTSLYYHATVNYPHFNLYPRIRKFKKTHLQVHEEVWSRQKTDLPKVKKTHLQLHNEAWEGKVEMAKTIRVVRRVRGPAPQPIKVTLVDFIYPMVMLYPPTKPIQTTPSPNRLREEQSLLVS